MSNDSTAKWKPATIEAVNQIMKIGFCWMTGNSEAVPAEKQPQILHSPPPN